MAFDFGQIGDVVSRFMDTDFIDIKRDSSGSLQEIYSNVKCHIAYSSVDNPDPATVDIKPVVQSLTVHLPLWADIRNNDYIVAKKIGSDGSIAAVYSGRCGNPVVSQGRKKVLVQMSGTEVGSPTPVPPKNPVKILVECVSGGENILEPFTIEEAEGKTVSVNAPDIEGFSVKECYLDGELQDGVSAEIKGVLGKHSVRFVYVALESPDSFRYLVDGIYTKNDGSLASGFHLYKRIPCSVSESNGVYTVECGNAYMRHGDSGKILEVKPGAKIALMPQKIFAEITGIAEAGDETVFMAVPFAPSDVEKAAYVCGWYG